MMSIGIVILIGIVLYLCLSGVSGKSEQSANVVSSSSGYSSGSSKKGGKNNPGFLIHTATSWKGKTDSTGCKFENFESLGYGIRAWYVNLFNKVKKGTIQDTNSMIDVLTPALAENPEPARQNYKNSVAQARTWLDLGTAVFNFEANPDWLTADNRQSELEWGFSEAVSYCYGGSVPQYFS